MDPENQFAVLEIVRIDGTNSFTIFGGCFVTIEPQVFCLLGIWAVAGESLIRENGQDFAGEIHLLGAMESIGEKDAGESNLVRAFENHKVNLYSKLANSSIYQITFVGL